MKTFLRHHFSLAFLIGAVISLKSQCTPTTVPLHEGLETITSNNQLPACWAASDLANGCKTFKNTGAQYTGFGGAAFFSGPGGNNYFYSRALTLLSGITYSAAVWKSVSTQNSANWYFSLMLGTSQTTTGLAPITSPSPVTNKIYTSTSNTFAVSTSGTYYVVVAATSAVAGASEYLYWDDLSVIIPCDVAGNNPTVTISASSTTICSGSSTGPTLTAYGADTYSWSNGVTTQTNAPTLVTSTLLAVTGTYTLTGCTGGSFIPLAVLPNPHVPINSSQPVICTGESVKLSSPYAVTISLNTGETGTVIYVSPTVTTTYTAKVTAPNSCTFNTQINIGVNPLPVITVNYSNAAICVGDPVTLIASGLTTYTWSSPQNTFNVPAITITPMQSITYSIAGTDINLCRNSTSVSIAVDPCTGIADPSTGSFPKIYPNPFSDQIIVVSSSDTETIVLMDPLGHEVYRASGGHIRIDAGHLPPGIYFLRTGRAVAIKVVKEK